MTTVAYRNGILAGDKAIFVTDHLTTSTKIWRLKDGRLVGGSGLLSVVNVWREWLENGGDRPAILADKEDGIRGVIIDTQGRMWRHDPYGVWLDEGEFLAIGSGAHHALGAMAFGASAAQAVKVASQFDPWTSSEINILCLEKTL